MSWPQNSNSNASSANNSSLSDEELHPVNDSATTNLDIKSAEAWFHRGVALYGQANTMKPFRLSEAYYNKWAAIDSQGKYDEAIEVFDKAIWIDPKNASAWSNKG